MTSVDQSSGTASVIELNILQQAFQKLASWDAVYFHFHHGLSVSQDKANGDRLIWTIASHGPFIESHNLSGQLIQSLELPRVKPLGTWPPNWYIVEGNGKSLAAKQTRDHPEWFFDIQSDLRPLDIKPLAETLIGRFQGDSHRFMVIGKFTEELQGSIVDESNLEEKSNYTFTGGTFPTFETVPSGNALLLGSYYSPIIIELDRNDGRMVKLIDAR